MDKILLILLIAGSSTLPAFAVLPAQSGIYIGKANVEYTDLAAAKSLVRKLPVELKIMPDGSAVFTGPDIDEQLQVESGVYHGVGFFQDNRQVGNMPLHFINDKKLKGTFHFAFPGTSEMMEGKFSLRKRD